MENSRNYFLAIGLSVLIFVVWQIIYVAPRLEEEQARQAALIEQQAQTAGSDASIPSATTPSGETAQLPNLQGLPAAQTIAREDALAESGERIEIDTEDLLAGFQETRPSLSESEARSLEAVYHPFRGKLARGYNKDDSSQGETTSPLRTTFR